MIACVAQSVEHFLGKEEVTGSNPVMSSKHKKRNIMAREKFDRSLPHINVGTIGHVDHGKTTLTAAITKVMSDTSGGAAIAYDDIDNDYNANSEDLKYVIIREKGVLLINDCSDATESMLEAQSRIHLRIVEGDQVKSLA